MVRLHEDNHAMIDKLLGVIETDLIDNLLDPMHDIVQKNANHETDEKKRKLWARASNLFDELYKRLAADLLHHMHSLLHPLNLDMYDAKNVPDLKWLKTEAKLRGMLREAFDPHHFPNADPEALKVVTALADDHKGVEALMKKAEGIAHDAYTQDTDRKSKQEWAKVRDYLSTMASWAKQRIIGPFVPLLSVGESKVVREDHERCEVGTPWNDKENKCMPLSAHLAKASFLAKSASSSARKAAESHNDDHAHHLSVYKRG